MPADSTCDTRQDDAAFPVRRWGRHTWTILSRLPLPIGLQGAIQPNCGSAAIQAMPSGCRSLAIMTSVSCGGNSMIRSRMSSTADHIGASAHEPERRRSSTAADRRRRHGLRRLSWRRESHASRTPGFEHVGSDRRGVAGGADKHFDRRDVAWGDGGRCARYSGVWSGSDAGRNLVRRTDPMSSDTADSISSPLPTTTSVDHRCRRRACEPHPDLGGGGSRPRFRQAVENDQPYAQNPRSHRRTLHRSRHRVRLRSRRTNCTSSGMARRSRAWRLTCDQSFVSETTGATTSWVRTIISRRWSVLAEPCRSQTAT